MVPRVLRLFALAMVLVVLTGCRDHVLDDGAYAFTVNEVLRDDCALAVQGVVPGGTLKTAGHQVTLSLTNSDVRLLGTYRYRLEEMTLDGSATNQPQTLRARECLVDLVSYHLDTVTTDDTHFTGSMAVNYDTRAFDECVCKFWFTLSATRQ